MNDQIEPSEVMKTFDKKGNLQSVIQYKFPKEEIKGFQVPKWTLVTGSLIVLSILIILIAAIVVVVFAPRDALHTENCKGRSCIKNFGLKCINNTCLCPSEYVYIDKCTLRKNYLDNCVYRTSCKEGTNLMCIDGICKCNSTSYWDGKACLNKGKYNSICSNSSQCLTNSILYCDKSLGKCACDATRYWDGIACIPRRTFNESCQIVPCQANKNLSCINKLCQCTSKQYWDSFSCKNKLNEYDSCSLTIQCLTPMNCTNATCQCDIYQYYDASNSSCKPQKNYSQSCTKNLNCRIDKHLECSGGRCNCVLPYLKWSASYVSCIIPATYSEACIVTSDCDTSKALICNSGTNCSCPSNLLSGKCDCPSRAIGAEYFWNGTNCVTAYRNGELCSNSSTSYMCQTLTQGTTCSGPAPFKCQCSSLQYFNTNNNKCETLLSINGTCTELDACRSDLGLSCQASLCQCDSSTQFWNGSLCINYYTYNSSGLCNDDNQCFGNLICMSASTISCNCPLIVTIGSCDCPAPVFGLEYFWNGSTCVESNDYNMSCSSALASYMCKNKTEGTFCSGSPSFKCVCSSSQYYNHFTKKCETLIANISTCTQVDACRSDLGLSCLTSLCQCNSTYQFWNGTSCANYLSYNEGTCTSSSQCNATSLLTCVLTAASTCNCPDVVPVGKCDCKPADSDNSYFWNSSTSTCVSAAPYNKPCSTGNYTCLTLAENTYCNLLTNTCMCDASIPSIWDGSMCTSCLPSWTFHRGSCFKISSADVPNALTDFTPAFVTGKCYNQPGVRIAILKNSDASSITFRSFLGNEDCYFDAYRSTGTIFSSFYTLGYTIDSSASVWKNNGAQDLCARIKKSPASSPSLLEFNDHHCGDNHRFICEY